MCWVKPKSRWEIVKTQRFLQNFKTIFFGLKKINISNSFRNMLNMAVPTTHLPKMLLFHFGICKHLKNSKMYMLLIQFNLTLERLAPQEVPRPLDIACCVKNKWESGHNRLNCRVQAALEACLGDCARSAPTIEQLLQ